MFLLTYLITSTAANAMPILQNLPYCNVLSSYFVQMLSVCPVYLTYVRRGLSKFSLWKPLAGYYSKTFVPAGPDAAEKV